MKFGTGLKLADPHGGCARFRVDLAASSAPVCLPAELAVGAYHV